jgi:hypothetical protein
MWKEGRQRDAGGFVFFGKKLMTARDAKNDASEVMIPCRSGAGCLEANSTGQIFDGAVFSLLD